MPVIAANLTSQVLSEIRALVKAGHYASPEQFLETAAFNQIALERGSRPEVVQATLRAPAEDGSMHEAAPSVPEAPARRVVDAVRSPPVGARQRSAVDASDRGVREALRRLGLSSMGSDLPTPRPTTTRPDSEYVWGQINRLFPLKLTCRAIAVAVSNRRQWEKLDAITQRLGDDASTLGSALETCDRAAGRKRDDLLATALPRQGNVASQVRFVTQFVARTTRAGDIYAGAVCQYGLAEFDGERLGLTAPGLELARLRNPVLDAGALESATSTLSREERALLRRHVMAHVPAERRDFSAVLAVIRAGATTPDALVAAIGSQLPAAWTSLMVRTHVSGLVARMADLELLRREWVGRNAKYQPGPAAVEISEASGPRSHHRGA